MSLWSVSHRWSRWICCVAQWPEMLKKCSAEYSHNSVEKQIICKSKESKQMNAHWTSCDFLSQCSTVANVSGHHCALDLSWLYFLMLDYCIYFWTSSCVGPLVILYPDAWILHIFLLWIASITTQHSSIKTKHKFCLTKECAKHLINVGLTLACKAFGVKTRICTFIIN